MKKNKTLFSGFLLIAALALSSVPAAAGIVVYTNQSDYAAAIAALTATPVNFANAQGFFGSTFTSGGLSFTGNPSCPPACSSGVFGSGNTVSGFSDQYTLYGSGLVNTTASASSNFYGISFTIGCASNCGLYQQMLFASSATDSNVKLIDSTTGLGLLPSQLSGSNYNWTLAGTQFFGIVSTSALTQFYVTSNTTVPNIEIGNVSTATGAAPTDTPEIATSLLIASGLAILSRFRKHTPSHAEPTLA